MLSSSGKKLRDRVALGKRKPHHAADVFQDRARLKLSERDDLADVVFAVLARNVIDHFAAAILAEVDVEVRHADALGIDEALEKKIELNRIDVRDLKTVRDERARARAPSRSDGNVIALGPSDEIRDDQEVSRRSPSFRSSRVLLRVARDRFFLFRPSPARPFLFEARLDEALFQPFARLCAEVQNDVELTLLVQILGLNFFGAIIRKMINRPALIVLEFEFEIAFVRDLHRVFHGLRKLRECFFHFLGRLDVKLRWNETLRTIEVEILAMLDALKNFVALGVLGVKIMAIDRRDALHSVALPPESKRLIDLILLREDPNSEARDKNPRQNAS